LFKIKIRSKRSLYEFHHSSGNIIEEGPYIIEFFFETSSFSVAEVYLIKKEKYKNSLGSRGNQITVEVGLEFGEGIAAVVGPQSDGDRVLAKRLDEPLGIDLLTGVADTTQLRRCYDLHLLQFE